MKLVWKNRKTSVLQAIKHYKQQVQSHQREKQQEIGKDARIKLLGKEKNLGR